VNAVLVRQETAVHAFPQTGQTVRTVQIDGEPWFVAADVCKILDIGRPQDTVRHLDDDERGRCLVDTPSAPQQMLIVSEAGLFSLMLRSRKDEAKQFKRWVCHDVLPSIRATGSYTAPAAGPSGTVATPTPRELALLVIREADRADQAEQRAAALAPAAEAWGVLADAAGDYSLRDAAHVLNRDPSISTGQNRLMAFLRDEGMVDAKGRPYVRYARHLVERPVSYTHPHSGESVLTSQIRITVAGLEHLRRRLGGLRTLAA
jgi:anti-repressor protein